MEGWEVNLGGDIIQLSNEKCRANDFSSSFPCVELDCLSQATGTITGTKDISGIKGVRNKFTRGQILYGKLRPYLNKYARPEFDGACSTEIWVLDTKDKNKLINDYLFYLVQSKDFRIAACTMAGTKMPRASWDVIENTNFLLPPLAEQKRIVEILSDADEAITMAEASFATRHKRLRGLIQSLIGAHQTSPKWDAIALDDIGSISSAGVDKKSIDGETQVTLLNYMDVYRLERIASNDLYHQVTAPISKVSSCNIQKGDIFFTPTSEKRDDIAHSAVAWEDIQGAVYSYHVVRLRPSISLDINFSSYAFQTNHFMRQAYRLADGSGQRYVISLGGFRNMTIALPPIEQQRAIGACLAEAGSELDKLSMEICALKKQKQGLMQQLLTGKLRLPEKVQ